MSGFELNVPIRLYWDVDPSRDELLPHYDGVCRDVLSLRLLSLNLTVVGDDVAAPIVRIMEHLAGKGPVVTLTVAAGGCTPALLHRLPSLGVRALLLRLGCVGDLHMLERVPEESKTAVGISFAVDSSSWRDLPRVISWCADHGVSLLSIPMQRLWQGEQPFFLRSQEKAELAAALAAVFIPEHLKLTIHDPFLWKLVFPAVPFPDGGCQGGNTMIAIGPDGTVYPCPSLPAPLGNVAMLSLRDIVLGPRKKGIRSEIIQCPSACGACGEYATCRGGCRGRALATHCTLNALDPGCLR